MEALRICDFRCLVTGEGLLSSGDPAASIRRSAGDDISFFRTTGADFGGRTVEPAVVYTVVVRLGMIRTEGLRLEGYVVGEGSSPGGVVGTACETLPSSQGSLLSFVPGVSFVARAVRTSDLSDAVIVEAEQRTVGTRFPSQSVRAGRDCYATAGEAGQAGHDGLRC